MREFREGLTVSWNCDRPFPGVSESISVRSTTVFAPSGTHCFDDVLQAMTPHLRAGCDHSLSASPSRPRDRVSANPVPCTAQNRSWIPVYREYANCQINKAPTIRTNIPNPANSPLVRHIPPNGSEIQRTIHCLLFG